MDDAQSGRPAAASLHMGHFSQLGADDKRASLGIMGGTFDPIHFGHLFCAQQAADVLDLDGVMFMPAGDPAFKQDRTIASAADRIEMCRLAVADNPLFDVSTLETERAGITYTSDTLLQLREYFPECVRLVFIVGSDSVETMEEWHDWKLLAKLADFACVSRPGTGSAGSVRRLEEDGFTIRQVEGPLLDISSTEIRMRCAQGRSIRYLTPPQVCEYIRRCGLYPYGA